MEQKFLEATKNILEKNLSILDKPFCDKKIVFVYDLNSKLSTYLSNAYIESLNKYEKLDIEIINFDEIEKDILKNKLMSLDEDSTVVLCQSTNFRLDDFRLRLNLKNQWVWAIEHNHLSYIKDNQIETYADSLEYKEEYKILSEKLKIKSDNAKSMKVISKNWDILNLESGLEDMKQNVWNFEWRIRAWSFPIWENFTEIEDFSKLNWKVSIKAFPNEDFQVILSDEPFTLELKESIIIWYSKNTPTEFVELFEKIKSWEDGEVYLRELWFWLNTWINWDNILSDVNAFERISWFHISLWKKHWIYRKKFHRKIIQRYHIDIFPDVESIYFDDDLVFSKWEYLSWLLTFNI